MTENGSINERRGLNVNQHLFKNGFDLNMGRVRKSNIHLIFISVEKKKLGFKSSFCRLFWVYIGILFKLSTLFDVGHVEMFEKCKLKQSEINMHLYPYHLNKVDLFTRSSTFCWHRINGIINFFSALQLIL